ncbi:MAG: hypothetical protein QXF56_01645 [Candidatus Micrarchaeia archaeon]
MNGEFSIKAFAQISEDKVSIVGGFYANLDMGYNNKEDEKVIICIPKKFRIG